MTQLPHEAAFQLRTDLQAYGPNARLLFALETRFRISDIHTEASNSLTDARDDKKCDAIHIDRDLGIAVVAQAYECANPKAKGAAPANKACDLNTAISWIISRPIADLPEALAPAVGDLRAAIDAGEVNALEFWYVHNLPEGKNVEEELSSVEHTLQTSLNAAFPDHDLILTAKEVGQKTLAEWYESLEAPILVSEEFRIPIPGHYEVQSEKWRALVTSVPAKWLRSVWQSHKSNVFSANVRDYLGSRRSDKNVNNGIKETLQNVPESFWVYNNGITALVNDYAVDDGEIVVQGLSIVNGAQTTGAIGSISQVPDETALVPARFVKCGDTETIASIIQYNNTQNAIKAADFRSNDSIQRRLRDEFQLIPDAAYLGGRRGGGTDAIARTANLLPSDTCVQALASFHQDPTVAYNRKSDLWLSDSLYSRHFSDETHADHIVFCFSLLRCIEARKRQLINKGKQDLLTGAETSQLAFLRKRGATFLLLAVIAKSLETMIGKRIVNPFRVSFGPTVSPAVGQDHWEPIVRVVSAFTSTMSDAAEANLKNIERVKEMLSMFEAMVASVAEANRSIFQTFAHKVVIRPERQT